MHHIYFRHHVATSATTYQLPTPHPPHPRNTTVCGEHMTKMREEATAEFWVGFTISCRTTDTMLLHHIPHHGADLAGLRAAISYSLTEAPFEPPSLRQMSAEASDFRNMALIQEHIAEPAVIIRALSTCTTSAQRQNSFPWPVILPISKISPCSCNE